MTRYRTIVADPPWAYPEGLPIGLIPKRATVNWGRTPTPYSSMAVEDIAALPVADLAETDAHLYLWTTNRYLRRAFEVVDAWGFRYGQTLVWAKTPMGKGPGGAFAQNAEFVLFCRRGSLAHLTKQDTVWWNWKRTGVHSRKPDGFLDTVEQVSPGPYLELFARRNRLGWDGWGLESLNHVEVAS